MSNTDTCKQMQLQSHLEKQRTLYKKFLSAITARYHCELALWNMGPDGKKDTKQILREILHQRHVAWWNHMDEVYPRVYVGDETAAKDTAGLKKAGITHILNASHVSSCSTPLGVNTSAQFYQIRNFKCEFLGIPALDINGFKINRFFDQAADFIEKAVNANGKVLVHCYMGISRSATLAIAYLMIKKKMTASESLKQLRTARNVYPNDGFLDQLCELEVKLKEEN